MVVNLVNSPDFAPVRGVDGGIETRLVAPHRLKDIDIFLRSVNMLGLTPFWTPLRWLQKPQLYQMDRRLAEIVLLVVSQPLPARSAKPAVLRHIASADLFRHLPVRFIKLG